MKKLIIQQIIAGALLTFAFAPFELFFFGVIALHLLLKHAFSSESAKASFISGVVFGFSHYLSSLYWIANSLTFELDKFFWLIPISLSVIPLSLSIFIGLFSLIAFKLKNLNKYLLTFLLPITWVIIEIIRGYMIIPFPWNFIGYTSVFSIELMQLAYWTEVLGLSFIVTLFSFSFAMKKKEIYFFSTFVMLIAFFVGYLRLNQENAKQIKQTFQIIQPNFLNPIITTENQVQNNIKILHKMVNSTKEKIDFVILPESSIPIPSELSEGYIDLIKNLSINTKNIITGIDRIASDGYYNSVVVINKNNGLVGYYDKKHLAPFGEYIPFANLFQISKIASGLSTFSFGKANEVIKLPEIGNVEFMICYDSIFPSFNKKDIKLIINITNDIWFGFSVGPHQHLAIARFRAIEQNAKMIRVANNGISAIIDNKGRIIKKTNLFERGSLLVNSLE